MSLPCWRFFWFQTTSYRIFDQRSLKLIEINYLLIFTIIYKHIFNTSKNRNRLGTTHKKKKSNIVQKRLYFIVYCNLHCTSMNDIWASKRTHTHFFIKYIFSNVNAYSTFKRFQNEHQYYYAKIAQIRFHVTNLTLSKGC